MRVDRTRARGRAGAAWIPILVLALLVSVGPAAPARGQPVEPPPACPRPPAAQPPDPTSALAGPPLLSATKAQVWYLPRSASAGGPDPVGASAREVVPGAAGTPVFQGDGVSVAADGEGALDVADAVRVRIFPDAQLSLCAQGTVTAGAPVLVSFQLWLGAIFGSVTPAALAGERVTVQTDSALVSVVGTRVLVYTRPGVGTWVVVTEGTATVSSMGCDVDVDPGCEVDVPVGQQTLVEVDRPPTPPAPATRGAVPAHFASFEELTGCSFGEVDAVPVDALDQALRVGCQTVPPTPTIDPAVGPVTPTQTPAQRLTQFTYGTLLADLANAGLARAGGFTHMWAFLSWKNVEPQRGRFLFKETNQFGTVPNDLTNVLEAARKAGLRVVLRLDDPPDWAGGAVDRLNAADVEQYVQEIVQYGADVIDYVEVFNELNLPREWGQRRPNPAAYADLLRGAYRGGKRAKPGVVIVSAGPSQRTGGLGGTMEDVDWLEGLYAAGGQTAFDALGMHAYLGSFPPETEPTCSPLCFRNIELYRAVMVRRGDPRSAFITEMGALEQTPISLGQFDWMKLAPELRADYLTRALRMGYAEYPWLLGAMVFNLDYARGNPATSERAWFSLLDANRAPRLAYTRIQAARARGDLP